MKLADFSLTRKNVVQFLEYMVGGGIYFWTGFATFAFFYGSQHWAWFPAKVAADVVGASLAYLVQRYWAFNNKRLAGHDGEVIKRYTLINLLTYLVDYAMIWSLYTMGFSPYVGLFISAGFFTLWNYVWYRFWVFYVKRGTSSKEVV